MEDKFDLDAHLLKELDRTKKWWTMPKKSKLHWIISLIISQGIPFEQGRTIRQKLYDQIDSHDFEYDLIKKITMDEWKELSLSESKIRCIKNILKLGDNPTIEQLEQISGIGPWTIKSLKLQCYDAPDIFLEEDYWIRKKLKEIYELSTVPTMSVAKVMAKRWKKNMRSDVTKFLWRLKTEGSIALIKGERLKQEHFLPLPK